jgi:hypothetical protein
MTNLKRPFIILLALISPLSSLLLHAHAQDGAEPGVFRSPDLEMTVTAGFGKLQVNPFTGGWTPFRISLVNNGNPISGRLVVRTESNPNPNSQVREFVKAIQLPTGSRQLHEIAVYLNSAHKEPEIILEADGDPVARATVKAERDFSANERLEIAVVDSEQTTLNNINSIEIAQPANRSVFKNGPPKPQADQTTSQPPPPPPPPPRRGRNRQGTVAHPVVISAEDMPRDFVSYDSLDVVVLGDAPVSLLTQEQARALKLWVASGGLLIVTGGADFAGLRASGLDSLLPVEVQGANSTPSIAELSDTYGRFESADPQLLMSAAARRGARTLLGTDDRAIVGERDYGSGIVRFLAINPKINPFRGWGAAKDLWNDLLLPAIDAAPSQTNWITRGARGNSRSSSWGIQNYLYELAEIKPPSANYFLLFLLAYLLTVGPVNYLALRWMKKLDLAWITIPGAIVLFTAVSLTVAQLSRGGGTIAADVTLVEFNQRDGVSRAMSALMIMPSSKGAQRMQFDGGDTFAIDTAGNFDSRPTSSEHIEVERNPKQFTLNVPMNTWTSGVFNVRSVSESRAQLISVPALVNGKDATPQVRIKNISDAALTSAVYMSAAGLSDPFDLAADEEKVIALNPPQPSTFSTWFKSQLAQGSAEERVFTELSFVLDREIGGQQVLRQGFFDTRQMTDALKLLERPLIVGFVEGNPVEMNFQSSLKRRSKSFYVIHL